MTKVYDRFVCITNPTSDKATATLKICESIEDAESWKNERPDSRVRADGGRIRQDKKPVTTPIILSTLEDKLSELMSRFFQSMSGFHVLAGISVSVLPVIQANYITETMYGDLIKSLDVISDDGDYAILGATKDNHHHISMHLKRMHEIDAAARVLPGAVLLSLVATFDSLIVDIIKLMLESRPDRIKDSSKSMTVSEILSMSSFDDVVAKVIEDETDNIMRGSHREQIEFFEKNFNIKFPRDHVHWSDFLEIFERRNLVAHGDLIINDIYLQNCRKFGLDIQKFEKGVPLALGRKYILRSSDICLEIGLELICLLWKQHLGKSLQKAYDKMSAITYDLIRAQRFLLASRLLEFSLGGSKAGVSDKTVKRMHINLANAYKKQNDPLKAKAVLAKIDWSATSDDFKICIAALEDDIPAFVGLMPRIASDPQMGMWAFREWPVFDHVREHATVGARFRELFGEDINKGPPIAQNERLRKTQENSDVDAH